MKTLITSTLTIATIAAAALGPAGTAGAFPSSGTAEDVVAGLEDEGYNVQVNGSVQVPLKLCTATDVHPTLHDSDSRADKQQTQVFVDVSCPSHD